ncbi:MAG: FAD:protein FMN transferase [Pirellulaceae bacterium]|nr:FAD:protein FMN transferase [Pirellulaceae bacterium]
MSGSTPSDPDRAATLRVRRSAAARWLVRAYRLLVLAAAGGLVWVAAAQSRSDALGPLVTLEEARGLFRDAARLGPRDPDRNGHWVYAADGVPVGYVLRTSPEADQIIGYAGPSDLVIGLAPDGRVRGVQLAASQDTPAHVEQVRGHAAFWKSLAGWHPAQRSLPEVEAVSGSTLTSLAMTEAVARRLQGDKGGSLRFPQPPTLDELRRFWPNAAACAADVPRAGWHEVRDQRGQLLGYAVRTAPWSDNVPGYRGPSEALVAVASDQESLLGVGLRHSYDTPEYVTRVRDDEAFWRQLAEWSVADWARIELSRSGIEGVSGATQTSYAVAEGLRRRFAADAAAETPGTPSLASEVRPRDMGLLLLVIGSLVIAFTPLRGSRVVRTVWQVLLMLGFGFWFGDLLSLALLAGWFRHGLPWRTAPALLLLVAVALAVPWTTRRQVYCHHLCPHGAAQEWLGRWRRLHVRLPARLSRGLRFLPAMMLGAALLLAVVVPRFDLAALEPFDGWVLKWSAVGSFSVLVASLLVSLFVPMGYCRYGCPTGALLKLVRSHGRGDRWGVPEAAAGLAVLLASVCLAAASPANLSRLLWPARERPCTELLGEAFGTTWRIRFRRPLRDAASVREAIADELERIESRLSHWRVDSETSRFNASQTTLEMEFSAELVQLVERAQWFSRETDGAYDITIGPLVAAWGYGPAGLREQPPADDELAELLQHTGWQRVSVDREFNTLRKQHPRLELDLGSLLQGYAVDRLVELLAEREAGDCLIEVGGELRARGGWTVAIENPSDPARPLRTFELRDQALATSGTYRASADGRSRARHIISPRTGRPVETSWPLVAVVAPTCLEADVWATALLASPRDLAERLIEKHDLEAVHP